MLGYAVAASCLGIAQHPVPNFGQGPPALVRGQVFIRHAEKGNKRSTTSTVTFTSQLTTRELIARLRLYATHRWYLLYGGKILEPDAFIPAHLRGQTLDLAGTLKGGLGKDPAPISDGPGENTQGEGMEDASNKDALPGNDTSVDELPNLDRVIAWRWCRDLINPDQPHPGAGDISTDDTEILFLARRSKYHLSILPLCRGVPRLDETIFFFEPQFLLQVLSRSFASLGFPPPLFGLSVFFSSHSFIDPLTNKPI